MSLKIVRNDIAKMNADVIVNTASPDVNIGPGCDFAVYSAAGSDKLLAYRREKIGIRNEGDVFVTPGFNLPAKYIIHAVSPLYRDGNSGEEELLRACYGKALRTFSDLLADEATKKNFDSAEGHIPSIAFPLISTGSFGYPKEEGMRIALDEINAFFINRANENTQTESEAGIKEKHDSDVLVYLVVFDEESSKLGRTVTPGLKEYINRNYIDEKAMNLRTAPKESESGRSSFFNLFSRARSALKSAKPALQSENGIQKSERSACFGAAKPAAGQNKSAPQSEVLQASQMMAQRPVPMPASMPVKKTAQASAENAARENIREAVCMSAEESAAPAAFSLDSEEDFAELKRKLDERRKHLADSFSEYLLFLIEQKGMTNAEVYKRAIVDKKLFAKIKNDTLYHPQKLTCLCLCVGARLNIDETRDLLARAGYALSPCDMRDIIFSYFIENEIYDMVELDIQLEEYDLPPIIA